MRALLAIDEGLLSPGVAALRRSLIEDGLEIVMLGADSREASAGSRRPDSMLSVGGDRRHLIFELDGSPTDCVHIALGTDWVGEVDIVIAGIGMTPSAGVDGGDPVFAAAREAALMGRPALALSIDVAHGADCSWSGVVAGELAAWIIAVPPPARCVLKIDVPAELAGRGLRLASADASPARPDDHVTLVPVALDAASGGIAGEQLFAWAEEALLSINPRLGAAGSRCLEGCCG